MNHTSRFCIPLFMSLVATIALASKEKTADQWLKQADQIRNPSSSFSMSIQVESDGQESEFLVHLKGSDKTMIITKSPARDRGRNMLMLDRDFHAYVPNLKRSMRLSLAQKLSGQVANGDISRTRWFGDYIAKIEKQTDKTVQLFLKANKDNLTYSAFRLWIEKSTNRPLKAEYLASNEKTILKQAYFEKYKKMAGLERPSVIRIVDPAEKTSQIKVIQMKNENFEDSFFTIRNMESQK
jgi:outer membrane lipoprotein-sorting protein